MMKNCRKLSNSAQTAIEYLLLLGVVMAIVLIGMKTYLPRTGAASNLYFDRVTNTLLGAPSTCGDCICDVNTAENKYCYMDCSGAPCP